ncbi:hypothetical protein B0O99DRAFT_509642 [Bisporella sp. PMI_857]|nr:hypothetical protein B0O99DRAFT_509642 [Bisporella sp. PMI_857]
MSTPAAKRRRIDAASSTLSKPFRTPFKSPVKQSSDSTPNTSSPLKHVSSSSKSVTAAPLTGKTPSFATFAITPRQFAKRTFTSPVQTAALNADPDIALLSKKQKELEKQLREVKEQLDTAEQARKIERDSAKEGSSGVVDGELIELIGKWRGASRQAAEELFGKRQQESHGGWDGPAEQADYGEDDDGQKKDLEKRDLYAEYDIDPETENEKSQREKGVGDTGELPEQEDEFTMAMMLRTLNVDLDLIGYDREAQIWTD